MKIYLKFDFNKTCKKVLEDCFNQLGVTYTISGLGEVDIENPLNAEQLEWLQTTLNSYGINIIDDEKSALVQRIKDTITEMIYLDEKAKLYKVSTYLSDKLNYSYNHLSNVFSETTYSSIENFVILKKIDYAKTLIAENNLTLTEIAFRLNYSSVAHLSGQFKKTTGLTPSVFQRIIMKRKELS
ncbi:helix-turn-helix transcriptional regulator [Aurantibacter crassamenti]|uniref:helix-turn-helix domain-containing protein n=1 Tax=Aurantibacter crassamenti TaxID=1837375 RepID=UPI00193AB28C|nr:AraC family transcriptional regulator [Aurantibacter crassamenti]MBM1104574.1 helix-turn-helix transcriptional regulator [Aurantibacter crassamenti]